jgi:hypothetical protein
MLLRLPPSRKWRTIFVPVKRWLLAASESSLGTFQI